MPALENYLKQWQEAGDPVRFVLIDSLTAINSGSQSEESKMEYARPVRQLTKIADTYGATIVLIHHANANGNARGSTDIHDGVCESWAFSTHDEATGQRLLRVLKNRAGKPPGRYKFDFNPSTHTFTYAGEDGEDNGTATTHQKRIELWLTESNHRGIPYEAEELGEQLGIPSGSARRALNELWSKDLIQRELRKRGRVSRYLYWIGDLRSEYMDGDHSPHADHPKADGDHSSDHRQNTDEMGISSTVITVIAENPCFLKNQKSDLPENSDHRDHRRKVPESRGVDDDQFALDGDHSPTVITVANVGDIVVAKSSARWHKTGSDKLNTRLLRPSQKDKATIPVLELPDEIFHELTAPCRVIEVNRTGDRLKLRNQQTGRTWVGNADGIEVLQAVP